MGAYLKILLIRHGESVGNVEGRLEGQMSTPLSVKGQQQAHRLSSYLNQCYAQPDSIYSSPLQRAVETASYLTSAGPIRLNPSLQELHQGIFQGLTWAEACHRYPQICSSLTATLDYQPVPEAETLAAAYERAANWYQSLWHEHPAGGWVWAVTHGGFMQQLIRVILGCDRTWQLPIHHTALFEFWLLNPAVTQASQHNPEYWKILRFNDIPHLKNDI